MKAKAFDREAYKARWGMCLRRSHRNMPAGLAHMDNGQGVCRVCKEPRRLEYYSGPWHVEILAERRNAAKAVVSSG